MLLVGLLVACLPLAGGVAAPLVFLLGAIVVVAWAAIAVHAWHTVARRRRLVGVEPGGTGGAVLWLIPLVLALGAGLWIAGGSDADPALALDAYLADWDAGRTAAAAGRFVRPPTDAALRAAWAGQDGALRNAVVRVVTEEPAVEADPTRRFHGLRWVDLGATPDGAHTLALEAPRSERVRNLVLGVLPTTSQRLVPVERLGTATLRPVPVEGGIGPFGPVVAWRIEHLELAGVSATGG